MKRLPNFKASFITETFFPGIDPEDINQGQCFHWAYIAHRLFDGVDLYDIPYHAFVKYKGKYYDSECPRGVRNWRDLPACNWGKWHKAPSLQSLDSFKREWASQPRRFKTSWEEIEATVMETIEHGGYH